MDLPFIGCCQDLQVKRSAMKIVGIIPARYQSTRFPGKPLVDLAGKPMIQHVYERARRASGLHRLLVATDDIRIAEAVCAFGGEAVLTGQEHPSGTDRLAEAARLLGLHDDDLLVNIQGDEPMLEPVMIDLLVAALHDSATCPMASLACISQSEAAFHNPNVVKVVVDKDWKALYFSRSPIPHRRDGAGGPLAFLHHLGFYAYRQAFLQRFTRYRPRQLENLEKLEQLRALEYGHAIQMALSPVVTHGVDTPEDLQIILADWGRESK
jgi:3-deoxy-manno-octulosonate cytidylyltransferase (CMP-KDO synthetase)